MAFDPEGNPLVAESGAGRVVRLSGSSAETVVDGLQRPQGILVAAGQLYIVDTFLVVVFGGAASLLGTIASAFTISQTQSTLEFFLSGSMAKVITLLTIVAILMMRPQGLFALKVRK